MLQVVRRGAAAAPNFPDARRRRRGALAGGLFPPSCFTPRSFPPPRALPGARPPTSPQVFWGAFKAPRPRGDPARCCSAGLSGAPALRYFPRGVEGKLGLGCSGAQPCAVLPEGSLALPGWPPPSAPPPGPAALGVQPHGSGTPKPPFGGGAGGGGEGGQTEGGGEELRTVLAGIGNGLSLVSPVYLTLSR